MIQRHHSSDKRNLFFASLIIFTIVLFSFYPAIKNGFINWDDNACVFENKHLNKPITEAVEFFFGPHYVIGNYIPFTMIIYTVEYHAAGLNPHFFHTINLFIHILNVLLVFWFIYLLSENKILVAGIVSLFFGIHPMHVESVAWIAELKDLLYSTFYILGLIYFYKHIKFLKEKKIKSEPTFVSDYFKSLLPVFVLFLFSLLSKPAAIVFPFVLLLMDFYLQRKMEKSVWLEKLPFLILSVVFGLIALHAQKSDRLLHDYYPMSQRIFFASHSFILYLCKCFMPYNLSIFYPYPRVVDGHLPFIYYLSPVLILILIYGVFKSLKSSRLIVFGFLFFTVNLILVLQIVSFGEAVMADRYSYISYIGLLFIIAMLIQSLSDAKNKYNPLGLIVIGICVLLCSYQTRARCMVWKDDATVAADLLKKFPNSELALNNMGFIYYCQKNYDKAIDLYKRAIESKPDYVMAYINLAEAYQRVNAIEESLQTIDKAILNTKPDFNVFNHKGYLLMILKKQTEAILCFKESIRLKKENVSPYSNLAQCYYEIHDYEKSLKNLEIALSFEPDNYQFLNSKGYILMIMGEYYKASEFLNACLRIKPDYEIASANLSECNRKINEVKVQK